MTPIVAITWTADGDPHQCPGPACALCAYRRQRMAPDIDPSEEPIPTPRPVRPATKPQPRPVVVAPPIRDIPLLRAKTAPSWWTKSTPDDFTQQARQRQRRVP